ASVGEQATHYHASRGPHSERPWTSIFLVHALALPQYEGTIARWLNFAHDFYLSTAIRPGAVRSGCTTTRPAPPDARVMARKRCGKSRGGGAVGMRGSIALGKSSEELPGPTSPGLHPMNIQGDVIYSKAKLGRMAQAVARSSRPLRMSFLRFRRSLPKNR